MNRILKIRQKIEAFALALVVYLPWLEKLRSFFSILQQTCCGKKSGVIFELAMSSVLYFCEKRCSMMSLSKKNDLVKVSLSAVSGYGLGHVDYFDKFQVIWKMNWSFIGTLISMY